MNANRELLERAHGAFNARDLEAALATLDAEAVWLAWKAATFMVTAVSATTGCGNGV
jgi:hypothetical protein